MAEVSARAKFNLSQRVSPGPDDRGRCSFMRSWGPSGTGRASTLAGPSVSVLSGTRLSSAFSRKSDTRETHAGRARPARFFLKKSGIHGIRRHLVISARMEIAISAGERAPIFSPIGPLMRESWAVEKPAAARRSNRLVWVCLEPKAPT